MTKFIVAACMFALHATPCLGQETPHVLVVYHSVTGNTAKMADAAAEGARRAHVNVVVKKVSDVTRADLEIADAIILGSPTQWSNMTSPIKAFIETWPDMVDKVGGAFATGGAPSGGKEHVVTSLVSAMLSHGMIVAGPVYSEGTFRFGAAGATATTGPGNEGVSEAELNEARELGHRVALIAVRVGARSALPAPVSLCETGKEQSPIDIRAATTARLSALQFAYHPATVSIRNSGHDVMAAFRDTMTLRVGDVDYRLLQFHYHHPSEHLVNGKASPLEVHLVHANPKGELAVVGVLFTEGKSNEVLEVMLGGVGKESSLDPVGLLPRDRTYVTYDGSLTTPPCSEHVKWLVMDQTMTASRGQIERLKSLVEPNARPIQALGARKLERSGKN